MKLSRDATITLSWSTLASIVASLAAVYGFGSSIIQKVMAGEITTEIAKQLLPIQAQISNQTAAQVVSLGATVKNLRTSITALEFKRDTCRGPDCWTVRDAGDLDAAKIDLRAAEDALKALKQ